MFFKRKKYEKKIYYENYEHGQSKQIVKLSQTKGLLKWALFSDTLIYSLDSNEKIEFEPNYGFCYDWRFNGLPLVYVNESSYSTSESMIMHGYGNNDIDKYFSAINSNLTFKDATNQLDPILSLLEDGFYEISEIVINPTDGNGKLFWDIKNYPFFSNATSSEFISCCSGNHYFSPDEYFLYPSQYSSRMNPERVDYYIDLYEKEHSLPYIITLSLPGNMVLCLDGHHKALASAKLGRFAKGLNIKRISPYQAYQSGEYYLSFYDDLKVSKKDYKFATANKLKKTAPVEFPQGQLNTEQWIDNYEINSFPTYFESQLCKFLDNPLLSVENASVALSDCNFDYLDYFLLYAKKNNIPDIDKLLISIVETDEVPRKIMKETLYLLTSIKNNNIEKYLINLLVDSSLDAQYRSIILEYW